MRSTTGMTVHAITSHPIPAAGHGAASPAFRHEDVCRGCGHGSSLHAADRSGTCLVCSQIRALRVPDRVLCRGYAGIA